jgi:starvation-inducible DNA-binding protein
MAVALGVRRREAMDTLDETLLQTRANMAIQTMGRSDGARTLQRSGELRDRPLGLSRQAREQSVGILNQLLQDTVMLRELYKKHHWQVRGPTFFQLHRLFDKHYKEQNELVDALAERIQTLGGVAKSMPQEVAELTRIPHPPADIEDVPTQLIRLLDAHELILQESRKGSRLADQAEDEGTSDLLVSAVIRTNELQVWFVSQHLEDVELIRAEGIETVGERTLDSAVEASPSPS